VENRSKEQESAHTLWFGRRGKWRVRIRRGGDGGGGAERPEGE